MSEVLDEQAIRADERRKTAEEIAQAILGAVCAPTETCDRECPDCVRYGQAQDDAVKALMIGGSRG